MKLKPGLWAFYARKQIAAYSTAPGHALSSRTKRRATMWLQHRQDHTP